MGDSLSAAYRMPVQRGWVALLEKILLDEECSVNIINASITGETSVRALTRLPKLLEQHNPSIVMLELGGNDGLRGLPVSELKANLSQMIELSRASDAITLQMAIRIPTNYGPRYSSAFTGLYPEVSTAMEVTLIPFFLEDIVSTNGMLLDDGIHPSELAQPLLMQQVLQSLRPLLACGE